MTDFDMTTGLIEYDKYPEVPRELIDEFNARLNATKEEADERLNEVRAAMAQSYGIIAGLSQEYHTLWMVDAQTMEMGLFRSTGYGTIADAVQMGIDLMNYNDFINRYIDEYVDEDYKEIVREQATPEEILKRTEDGSIYTVDYLRRQADGTRSYHQMAFALSDLLSENIQFVLGFRDINSIIVKEMQDAEEKKIAHEKLLEQYEIVKVLSRDYLNIYRLKLSTGLVNILKMDGYIFSDIADMEKMTYSYDALCDTYTRDCVYIEDVEDFKAAMDIDTVRTRLSESDEYEGSYRILRDGKISFYQFVFLASGEDNNDNLIVAFKNIDALVEEARERENLRVLSETDQMTGLYNRVCGERKATEKIAGGVHGMLCIIDIDKFKNINDTYGHSVGDKAITGVADCLKRAFRDQDIVFRLGGDEFAVMAINVFDEVVGERIIARFFRNLEDIFIEEMGDYQITASVGAIIISGNKSELFEEYYKKADSCVYKSKELNRSAVTFYYEE